jgi:hypothetical protein
VIDVLVTVGFALVVVCSLKGKPALVLSLVVTGPLTVVPGAIRLARPGSWWWRTRYDEAKQRRSAERYPRRARRVGYPPEPPAA